MMLQKSLIFLIILKISACFPNQDLRVLRIPDLQVLSPEQVNSLEFQQQRKSFNTNTPRTSNDIEQTIKEVEQLIKTNPSLPRLTRGEILDLLDNITKTDLQQAQLSKKTEQYRDPKAIMVVMPYTPATVDEKDMESLYTKPPVTHIIGSDPVTKDESVKPTKPHYRRKPTSSNKTRNPESEKVFLRTRNDTKKVPTQITSPRSTEIKSTRARYQAEVTTEKYQATRMRYQPEISTEKYQATRVRYQPEITTEKYQATRVRYQPEITTEKYQAPTTTRRSIRRRPPTTESTQTTPTTYRPKTRRPVRRRTTTTSTEPPTTPTARYSNHKYSVEETDDYIDNNAFKIVPPPQLAYPSEINTDLLDLIIQEDKRKEVYLKPEALVQSTTTVYPTKTTTSPLVDDINIPKHLHGVVKDMHLDNFKEPEKYHSQYETTTLKDKKKENPDFEREEVKKLLESIGALPDTTTLPTTKIPDASNIADTLTPEMRDLLMSFGLLPNPNESKNNDQEAPPVSYNPEKAEVKPDSYVGFKPLPEDGDSRDEMESLLASFGLGRSARREKSFKTDKNKANKLNFDVIPDKFMPVIRDIGLTEQSKKNVPQALLTKVSEKSQHVFNPKDQYASEEELTKLSKLMDIIKQLEKLNRTATDEDLKKIDFGQLKDLVNSLNNSTDDFVALDEKAGPNPTNFDFGIIKNEVKRQESSTLSTSTSTTTSTTEAAKTPNLSDLEASFGGQAAVTTEAAPVETTTASKRTGFYYLVDWNTFLDIDDQKGKRVNLRFQPTIGDPKRFLSVSVP